MTASSNQQHMKRLTLSALFVLALSSLAWGQGNSGGLQNAKCTLTLAQAPELRGFRLGMNQERVLARFPGISVERVDAFGLTKVRLTLMNHDDYPGGSVGRDRGVQIDIAAGTTEGRSFLVDSSRFPDLKGVNGIRLRFIDGRISYLQMGYDDSVVWNDVDEFVRAISKPLGLAGNWQRSSDSDNTKEKELPCDGFLIMAGLGGDTRDYHVGAQLSLEDVVASRMIEKRQSDQKEKVKRQEEERRKTFKP
jgi:hypothetical protein